MVSYDDLENAFFFVSMDMPGINEAILDKKTGEIYYRSEFSGEDEFPEDYDYSDDYIEIPHKNDLDLGANLVFEFVSAYLPEELDKVTYFFKRRGAYGRYKELLEFRGLLDKWYEFEDERKKSTLLEWCKENDIEVE